MNKTSGKQRNTTSGSTDDVKLFRQFLAGSDEAFKAFFERHNQRLFAYSLKMTRDRRIAEDLVQEAWIRAVNLRTKESAPVQNPVGLMVRIVRNLCLDHSRSNKNLQSLDDTYEGEGLSYELRDRTAEQEIVLRCLERLSFDYRETLVLNLYSGYSYEEIAVMLDKSPDAIWARASRARKKLREMVTSELEREEQRLRVFTHQKRKMQ